MDNIEFEKLLGEPILIFEKALNNDFEKSVNIKDLYQIKEDSALKNFYGTSYKAITIQKGESDEVRAITLIFNEVLSRQFYDSFNAQYGKPNNIQIKGDEKIISDSGSLAKEKTPFGQKLIKRTYDLKEGAFEDNPLFIIWKKENYIIKAFFGYEQNMSTITFSKVD